jgi:hypothetical protein|tara:strand:+ start:76 stop:324 length:249 start_codon:yes stop_codon:yes gene_type:complete
VVEEVCVVQILDQQPPVVVQVVVDIMATLGNLVITRQQLHHKVILGVRPKARQVAVVEVPLVLVLRERVHLVVQVALDHRSL